MYASEQGTLNAQWNAAAQEEENARLRNSNLILEAELSIIKALSPDFGIDGNKFYYMLGNLPEDDCIVGFGDTPREAMSAFCRSFGYSKQ